jgi:hypothetical protein
MASVRLCVPLAAGILFFSSPAFADQDAATDLSPRSAPLFDQGKLLATSGVSAVEGEGGGGLAGWAMISGYGTSHGMGVNVHYTFVGLPDYQLVSPGIAIGLFDRLELSYAWQAFDTEATGAALGLGQGFTLHQNIFSAKLKLTGDVVYDQDSWLPQISVGVQHKENDRGVVIAALGAKNSVGTDFYLAATKLFLAQSLLVDATLRETKANQFGLLGFGGDKHNAYSAQFEGSVAYLISRKFAIGADVRTKPSNLAVAHEGDAYDIFAAYFLNKNLSATLAYADMGNIAIHKHQGGVYVSLQAGL